VARDDYVDSCGLGFQIQLLEVVYHVYEQVFEPD